VRLNVSRAFATGRAPLPQAEASAQEERISKEETAPQEEKEGGGCSSRKNDVQTRPTNTTGAEASVAPNPDTTPAPSMLNVASAQGATGTAATKSAQEPASDSDEVKDPDAGDGGMPETDVNSSSLLNGHPDSPDELDARAPHETKTDPPNLGDAPGRTGRE
jgi:hypothetical protein